MIGNNDLKHRNIQAFNQFFGLEFALKPLLVNKTPYRENWQALKGKKLSTRQQEVLARIETKVGVKG